MSMQQLHEVCLKPSWLPDIQLPSWDNYGGDLQPLGSTRCAWKPSSSSKFEILDTKTELLWGNLVMWPKVRKKVVSAAAFTGCGDQCCHCWWKCPQGLDWELLLYYTYVYMPSPSLYILFLFPYRNTHTHTHAHTLTTKITKPSPLWKNEASFIPSPSSMNKNLLTLPEHLESSTASPFMPQRAYPASL